MIGEKLEAQLSTLKQQHTSEKSELTQIAQRIESELKQEISRLEKTVPESTQQIITDLQQQISTLSTEKEQFEKPSQLNFQVLSQNIVFTHCPKKKLCFV